MERVVDGMYSYSERFGMTSPCPLLKERVADGFVVFNK
jgi:hypothetical protein